MNKLLENIERFLRDNNEEYFSYAWRTGISEILTTESKYSRLIDWINSEIKYYQDNMNVFNPAHKIDGYTNAFLRIYRDACMNITILLNFKHILLDDNTTVQMRENIEYTMCKLYNIKYNDILKIYVVGGIDGND